MPLKRLVSPQEIQIKTKLHKKNRSKITKWHSTLSSMQGISQTLHVWSFQTAIHHRKTRYSQNFESLLQLLTSWSPNERLQVQKYLPEMSEKASYHAP